MLNEDKIRLMTGISMLETEKGRDLSTVHRYFRGDYISHHMMRSFLGYTLCWCLGLTLAGMCRIEELMYTFDPAVLKGYVVRFGTWYAVGLLPYLLITFAVYYRRYQRAAVIQRAYLGRMKALERRYEFQDSIKERGREVRRS